MKRAFILGTTGQDGSYLSELLLAKGYEVHGLKRRSSSLNTARIDHIFEHPDFHLHYGDITDGTGLARLLAKIEPAEIYNLAAQSHVRVSFDMPEYTADATGMGALKLFETVRALGLPARIYQASSSEMFGNEPAPQNEETPFRPRSPYGCAKAFAHHCAVNYREAHGMFIACGILFNHESPRRGETFVTRKIARAAARIAQGLQNKVALGNLSARRDWGYAPDYCKAMWMMLQQNEPNDFVIGTGETHSVQEFAEEAFGHFGMDSRKFIEIDPQYQRPSEVDELLADAGKAKRVLGWSSSVKFDELVVIMCAAEAREAAKEKRWLQAA